MSRADRSVDGTSTGQHRGGISGVLTSVGRLCLGLAPPPPKGTPYDCCGRLRRVLPVDLSALSGVCGTGSCTGVEIVSGAESALGCSRPVCVALLANSARKALTTSSTTSPSEFGPGSSEAAGPYGSATAVPFGLDGPAVLSAFGGSDSSFKPVLSALGNTVAYSLCTMRRNLSKPKPLGKSLTPSRL